MELNKALNTLGRHINKRHPYINNGGCCVFASLVGRELLSLGIEAKVIVASREISITAEQFNNIQTDLAFNASLSAWNSNNIYFSHVGIEFSHNDKVWHYDTNGTHRAREELDGLPLYPGRLSIAEALHLAEDPEGWSSVFDRDEIPALYAYIKSFFRKTKIFLTKEPNPLILDLSLTTID